ncbi:MAG: S-layer homology domain-containing protein [Leptolyngbya sp. RL_3_1]|nr:S-layer homology domain-containing protein [Leptolyngbya sp. RL_3_1]
MTRAELATQMARAFNLPERTDAPTNFVDIPTAYWATDGIQAAVKMGFMQGYPNAVFQPEQTVPRVQVIAAIAAGLQLQPVDPAMVLPQYADRIEIPDWAQEKVAAAVTADIISSQPDQTELRPNQPATRAEVAAMLHAALVYLGAL